MLSPSSLLLALAAAAFRFTRAACCCCCYSLAAYLLCCCCKLLVCGSNSTMRQNTMLCLKVDHVMLTADVAQQDRACSTIEVSNRTRAHVATGPAGMSQQLCCACHTLNFLVSVGLMTLPASAAMYSVLQSTMLQSMRTWEGGLSGDI
jgi:hypothetical protein